MCLGASRQLAAKTNARIGASARIVCGRRISRAVVAIAGGRDLFNHRDAVCGVIEVARLVIQPNAAEPVRRTREFHPSHPCMIVS